MAIGKEERNSKRMFFGGGMGSLIPFRPRNTQSPPESSGASAVSQQELNQIYQEAREQMGYQPEPTEQPSPSSTTTPEKDSTD